MKLLICLACLTLLCGCSGLSLPLGTVAKVGSSAAVGYAAWELAPEDWSESERAALAAGSAAATWIVGELIEGKIDKDKAAAYKSGFATGRAYGARRQYAIIQEMQKSQTPGGRVKSVELPAPRIPGVNQVNHNVILEVME